MKRRRLVLALAGAATPSPFAALAQRQAARLGVLGTASGRTSGSSYDHFFDALAKAGWTEGRNLIVDWRQAEGDLDRIAPLAAELVALKPNVIFASTQPSSVAVLKATRTMDEISTEEVQVTRIICRAQNPVEIVERHRVSDSP